MKNLVLGVLVLSSTISQATIITTSNSTDSVKLVASSQSFEGRDSCNDMLDRISRELEEKGKVILNKDSICSKDFEDVRGGFIGTITILKH